MMITSEGMEKRREREALVSRGTGENLKRQNHPFGGGLRMLGNRSDQDRRWTRKKPLGKTRSGALLQHMSTSVRADGKACR